MKHYHFRKFDTYETGDDFARDTLSQANEATDAVAKIVGEDRLITRIVGAAALIAPGLSIMQAMGPHETHLTKVLINYLCDARGYGQPIADSRMGEDGEIYDES